MKLHILLACLCWNFSFIFSQVLYYEVGGNLPLSSPKSLRVLSTKNFEIVYEERYENLAKTTAKFAEAAYFDLSLPKNWDYRLKTKARINLFPNFWEFQSYFYSFQPGLYKNGIYFHHHRNVGFAYFTGDRHTFYAQIRYLISKFIIYDQLLGKPNLHFQNNLLLYLPDWFVEGAALFLSEGWNEKDEILMKQIQSHQWESLLMKPSNAPTLQTLRKSFWYFIAKEWKKEKINEIFYMTRLTRSIEGGLLTVLGQTHKTIMTRWIAFCETFYEHNPPPLSPIIPLRKNQRILGWDANSQFIVGLLEQNTSIFPFLYELQSHQLKIYTTRKLPFSVHHDFYPSIPVKLNAKGTHFLYPDLSQKNQLFLMDIAQLTVQTIALDKAFDGFNQFYPVPNSDDFIFSAYQQDNADLYLLKASGKVEALRKTPYTDELFPIAYDSNTILFASTLIDTTDKTYALLDFQRPKSIFQLNRQNLNSTLLLADNENNYIPLGAIKGNFIFQSGQSFPAQLFAGSMSNKSYKPITNHAYGCLYAVLTDSQAFIPLYSRHQLNIMRIPISLDTALTPRQADKRVFSMANLWNEELQQRKNQKQLEELWKQDTVEIDTLPDEKKPSPKVKYYVFDEEDTVKVITHKRRKKEKRQHVKYDELFFTIERAKIEDVQRHTLAPIITKVNVSFDLDPIYRFGVRNEIFLKDSRNTKDLRLMFTPFLSDFHSSFHQLEYHQRWGANQARIAFYKQSNYFKEPFWVRYNHATFSAGYGRFLSLNDKIRIDLQATKIARYDLRLVERRLLDGSTWNQQVVLEYEFKKLKTHQNYIYQGHHFTFSNTTAWYWRDRIFPFTNFEWDYRHYMALGHMVWMNRLKGGFSVGRERPRYFVGGWNQWLNAEFLNKQELPLLQSLESFYYTKVVPLRGFSYNARNGTQYLLFASEFRIPTGRILKRPSSGIPLYNFQWIVFGEIGTVWTTGNPFSQRNPIDAKIIERPPLTITVQSLKSPFIASVGIGAKFYVVSYPVRLEVAFPVEDYSFTKTKLALCLSYEF